MEFYLFTVPFELRRAIFLSSLDSLIINVVASLGLTLQTELSASIAGLKTGFETVRNVSISR